MTRSPAGRRWTVVALFIGAIAWAPSTGVPEARVVRRGAALIDAAAGKDAPRIFDALGSADAALQADAMHLPALFEYAHAVQALGARELAAGVWRDYLARADDDSRIVAYRRQRQARWPLDLTTRWRMLALPWLNAKTVTDLVRQYPEQARRWGEGIFLSGWADMMASGDCDAATRNLDKARMIGDALQTLSHETLLAESVAAIDRALGSGDATRIRALVDAHVAYRSGRILFAQQQFSLAANELEKARAGFTAGSSPMAGMASFFIASSALNDSRIDSAFRMLSEQVEAERKRPGHRVLLASALWNISICQGSMGRWSDAIDAANESLRIFDALGETGNDAAIHVMLAETFAFLGDTVESERHFIQAITKASLSGDRQRVLVALGSASSAELRRQRWQSARALAVLELKLAGNSSAPELVTTSLARLGVAEYRLGHSAAAEIAIGRAHRVAQRIRDESLRRKLIGDVTALHAAMLRDRDPRRAAELLTDSIGFHEKVNKAFALPELYLERGRCHLALHDDDGALSDFRRGIDHLETQRATVSDTNLRGGMFDDSRTLFTETIRLLLRHHDMPEAFAYAERGRARALLDQLGTSGGNEVAPLATEEELRAELPSGTLLVEYVTLPNELIIFTADEHRLAVTEVPVHAAEIDQNVTALLQTLTSNGSDREVRSFSSALYGMLLQPVQTAVAHAQRIVVVADGSLQRLPFSALFDPADRSYLIQRAEVIRAPSASVFVRASRAYGERAKGLPRTAAIFANPSTSLANLPMAEREGKSIARLYRHATLLMRGDATAANFASIGADADVIHYAGHAIVNNADARRSALLLTGSSFDTGAISGCSFRRTRVIVLAACSTMTGPTATAEGGTSVARAFIVSGVPSVIGTLWDVDDSQASRIAHAIHSSLAGGQTPAAALRTALCDAIRSNDPALRDPSAWAAFEVVGAGGR